MDPRGVPVSAVLVGGRRRSTLPLVVEAEDWEHGYHAADHLDHWLHLAERSPVPARLPKAFAVNRFRRGEDGRWLWPGFAEHGRVLSWVVGRLAGTAGATPTVAGLVPTVDELDLAGLGADPADVAAALAVDPGGWEAEAVGVAAWFDELGPRVPDALHERLAELQMRVADATR